MYFIGNLKFWSLENLDKETWLLFKLELDEDCT